MVSVHAHESVTPVYFLLHSCGLDCAEL